MTNPRTRAPFIWTAKQPIDRQGFLAVMTGRPPRSEQPNRWFLFRRVIDVADVPDHAPVQITVDGRYQLFIGNTCIGRGPVRCDPLHQKFDTIDIAPFLRPGRTVIGVIVHALGTDTSWYETTKGNWQPTFGHGGLWLESDLVRTDTQWRCLECAAWNSNTPRVNHSIGFIEDFDANHFPVSWLDGEFDDADWDATHELVSGGGGAEGFFGGITTRPFPVLLPAGIPPMAETIVRPARVVWQRGVVPDPALGLTQRSFNEQFADLPAEAVTGDILHAGTMIRTGAHDVCILLDFAMLHTGYPFFDITARGGEIVELAASEYLPGEFDAQGPAADARITPRPLLGADAHVTRYVARPGRQHFERFEWQAVKWLQIIVRNAPGGLEFHDIGVTQTNFPVEENGAFASSDGTLDKIWRMGADTLKLCMHDGWIDCPGREQRQWLGDATVEQLAGQVAFGPSVNALNAKYLRDVANSQRPDGLTQMFAPGDHATNGLLIPDWTLQWILNAGNHLLWSGDIETIADIFPNIERALAWFAQLQTDTGLIADSPYWHFMDWAGVGRSGLACTLNAQLAGCFAAASKMAAALENTRAARRYADTAAKIQTALEIFWDGRRGIYVDMVDPHTAVQNLRTSQHANAAMILWGGAPRPRWPEMMARISDPARLTFTAAPPIVPTGATLDPEHGVVLANTFYSHFVQCACVAAGRADLMLALVRTRWGAMLARGATTLWESFEPTASLCHGFSSTPTYQLTTGICGLQPGADGFAVLQFAPDLADLDHASATLDTVRGVVRAELKRHANGFSAQLSVPSGMAVQVTAPAGHHGVPTPGGYDFTRTQ